MMKDLLALIGQYDPAYPRKIQGARDDEIHRLEQIAHRPLPPNYKEFLKYMGKDMGDFVIPKSDFNISTVMKAYEDEEWPPPPGYLFIGACTQDPHEDYYLDCESQDATDCKVVRFSADSDLSDPQSIYVAYPSLNDLLFSCAFKDKRMSLLPVQALLIPSMSDDALKSAESTTGSLRTIGELAARLGFRRLPHTSAHFPMYDRSDAAILGNQDPVGGGLYVDVAASTEQTLKQLVQIIRDHTQLLGA